MRIGDWEDELGELDWDSLDEEFFVDSYFKENYVEGERYEVPNLSNRFESMSEPWISWFDTKYQPDDKGTKGDPRVRFRKQGDYIWRVWLQKEFEDIMNGTKSIFIFSEEKREGDREEHKKNMDKLRNRFQKLIKDGVKKVQERDEEHKDIVVKGSNKGYVELGVKDMIKIFEGESKDDGAWDFYQSIANKCILLLFQESRAVIREISHKDSLDDGDEKCKKCDKIYTKKGLKRHKKYCDDGKPPKWVEISMLERDFYIGLSEFIYRKMEKNIELLPVKKEYEVPRRKPTIKRASRIFSVFVLSILMAEGDIWRRLGRFDDMLLHLKDDEEVVRKGKKGKKGQHPNMIQFSDFLREEIGKCEVEDFENRGATRHASFRVLERNTNRWMNCQPEKHLKKEHEIGNKKFNHEGGYLRSPPYSHLRSSILGKKEKGELKIGRAVASDDSLKALNILQETQWEINLDFLQHVAYAKFADGRHGSIKNKKILIERINIRDEFRESYYPEGKEGVSREGELRLHQIKKIIDNIANTFWHSWALDWRGRVICKANLLSPHGSDIDRAFLRFKEWKFVGEKGWEWFRIFLFNFFEGKEDDRFHSKPDKKLSFTQRIDWIDEHEIVLREIVGNWNEENNRELLDLNQRPKAKSETFQRISALIEYDRLLEEKQVKDWSEIKSGHPVHFDASSNGLQHLSLLIDNENLAKEVNVISPKGVKADIYLKVCEIGKKNWENNGSKLRKYLSKLGLNTEQLECVKDLVFQRKISKLPTMTVFYGATRLDKCFIGRNGRGKPRYQCIKCNEPNCDHLFESKNRLICWHQKSPLYEAFEKDEKLKGLIENGGLLFAKEIHKKGKGSRQGKFAKCLVDDYREAIEEVTGGAVSKLQKYLENRIDKTIISPESSKSWLYAVVYSTEKKAEDDFDNFEKEVRGKYGTEYKAKRIKKYSYAVKEGHKINVNDYDKETGGPKGGTESSVRLSWTLPDKFKIIYKYNKVKKDATLQASGLYFLKDLMEIVAEKDSYHFFLNYLHRSDESEIKIDNEYIKHAIEHFDKDYDYEREKINTLKVKLLLDNKKKKDLEEILREKKIKGFNNLRKNDLAKLVVKEDLCEITDWEAIYSSAKKEEKTNNRIRTIYNFTTEKLGGNGNDFENSWLMHSSVSIRINFPEFTDMLDIRQMKIAAAANFIHSMDGAHMRAVVREFDRRIKDNGGHSSIWSIHDAFGTHACDINKLLEIIKSEMVNLHSEGNLSHWVPTKGAVEENGFRKRIKNKEIEISEYFVS